MKKLLVLLPVIFLLASCDVYVVEPVVPVDPRDMFTGTFEVNEYSDTYDEEWNYGIYVDKNGRGELIIDNFYNSDLRVFATVYDNTFSIPYQVVEGYAIQGSGRINGDKLTFSYSVRDTYTNNSPKDFCTATAWRD